MRLCYFYYKGMNESGYLSFNNINPNQHRGDTYKIFIKRKQSKISKNSDNLLLLSFDSTGTFTKFNFANEFKARDFMTMNKFLLIIKCFNKASMLTIK
ncbi:MAG TPA: hypothetical protein VMU83_13120 [Hanamia sp.]|nr:hypothetical protein [Hanamia sp.]